MKGAARLLLIFFICRLAFAAPPNEFALESTIWELAQNAARKAAAAENKVSNAKFALERAIRIRDAYKRSETESATIREQDMREAELRVQESELLLVEAQVIADIATIEQKLWLAKTAPLENLEAKKQLRALQVELWEKRLKLDETNSRRSKLRADFEAKTYATLVKLKEQGSINSRVVIEAEFRHLDAEDEYQFTRKAIHLTEDALRAARIRLAELNEQTSPGEINSPPPDHAVLGY